MPGCDVHAEQGIDVASAEGLFTRALAENSAGRHQRALKLLERAMDQLDRQRTSAGSDATTLLSSRIQMAMATAESELNGLGRGLMVLDGVRRAVERRPDPKVEVLLNLHLGYMQVRGGDFAAGRDHLDSAVALLEHADARSACNILLNRGMLRVYLGDLRRARMDYLAAVRRARDNGLLVEEAKARHNLGELEFFAGNLALSLSRMDEAAALGADLSRAVILVDRARVLREVGLYREADQALQEAGERFTSDRLWKDVGEVELARAECALLEGDIAAARRFAMRARDRFRRRHNDRWRRDAELVLLQADLAAGRPGGRLAGPAARLAVEFRADGLRNKERIAHLIAAEALLASGRLPDASTLATAIGRVRQGDPISVRIQIRLVRARMKVAALDGAGARREVSAGLEELARYRAQFGSVDLQTAGAVYGRQLAAMDVALALQEGKPGSVLAATERSRAISARLAPVTAPDDGAVGALLAELRQVSEQVRVTESDPSARGRAGEQRARIAELQSLLRSSAWAAEGGSAIAKPASLDSMLDSVTASGATLVSYFESGGELGAVVISGGRTTLRSLGAARAVPEVLRRLRADLDALATGSVSRAIEGVIRASIRSSAVHLERVLLDPLHLSDDRLVIVPTGMLSAVPWGLLAPLRARPVTVSPSVTAWKHGMRAEDVRDDRSVAVIVGPDLRFARDEAAAVRGVWGADPGGSERLSTQHDLLEAMKSKSIVHVAAHGLHQSENPLFSYIRMDDGPVFAYEFDLRTHMPDHVVLSACEAGRATIRPGDEPLGLTSVLLRMGTRCVVSAVARVHDEIAAEVMSTYHRGMADGLDSDRAIAEAAAGSPVEAAAFVCFGSAWSARGWSTLRMNEARG